MCLDLPYVSLKQGATFLVFLGGYLSRSIPLLKHI
jgi:hypothetical protein